MSLKEKPTMKSIVDRIRLMADKEYDGLIHDYIVTIFNRLSLNERKILLRGLIDIALIMDDRIFNPKLLEAIVGNAEVASDDEDPKEPKVVQGRSENKDLEVMNGQELIKLKSYMVKAGVWILGSILFILTSMLFLVDTDSKNPTVLTYIGRVIKIIIEG